MEQRQTAGARVAAFAVEALGFKFRISVFAWDVFENVAGLAFELAADGRQRGKANCTRPARLENGEVLDRDADCVRHVAQAALALGQHDVEVDNDGHVASSDGEIKFGLKGNRVCKDVSEGDQKYADRNRPDVDNVARDKEEQVSTSL